MDLQFPTYNNQPPLQRKGKRENVYKKLCRAISWVRSIDPTGVDYDNWAKIWQFIMLAHEKKKEEMNQEGSRIRNK